MVQFTPADFTAVHIVAADFALAPPAGEVSAQRSMASRNHASSKVAVPAHSAALTMEESRGASPLVGGRALVEASMEVAVSTAAEVMAEAVTGNSIHYCKETDDREKHHANEQYDA